MSKIDVRPVVADYGVFENGELRLVLASRTNAELIKKIIDFDSAVPGVARPITSKELFVEEDSTNTDLLDSTSFEDSMETIDQIIGGFIQHQNGGGILYDSIKQSAKMHKCSSFDAQQDRRLRRVETYALADPTGYTENSKMNFVEYSVSDDSHTYQVHQEIMDHIVKDMDELFLDVAANIVGDHLEIRFSCVDSDHDSLEAFFVGNESIMYKYVSHKFPQYSITDGELLHTIIGNHVLRVFVKVDSSNFKLTRKDIEAQYFTDKLLANSVQSISKSLNQEISDNIGLALMEYENMLRNSDNLLFSDAGKYIIFDIHLRIMQLLSKL